MKFRSGKVLKLIDQKTIKVRSSYTFRWPKLGKIVKYYRDFLVHVPNGLEFEEGERVNLKEIAKVSKRKALLALKI